MLGTLREMAQADVIFRRPRGLVFSGELMWELLERTFGVAEMYIFLISFNWSSVARVLQGLIELDDLKVFVCLYLLRSNCKDSLVFHRVCQNKGSIFAMNICSPMDHGNVAYV